jgi:Bacterial Ig-like domain (group 3)
MRRRSFRMFNAVVILACLALAVSAGRAVAATAAPSATSATSATPTGTTTSLVLGEPTVDYGQESVERLSVTVAATGTVAPTGTVTISSGSATVCAITLAPVSAATAGGSCSPAASAFAPGSYQLTAAYPADTANAASASVPVTLAVSKGATTTSLSLSSPSVGYAAQPSEELSVAVQSPDGDIPDGSVQVSAGSTPVCTITLSAGAGSCAPAADAFAPGSYQLTASYAGSPDYAASGSEDEALTVSESATTTTLTLSAPTVSYGDEETVQARIAVSAADTVTPTGSVSVVSGAVVLCKIALSVVSDSTCALPSAVEFAPGSYRLSAEYNGTGGDGSSISAAQTLTVAPAGTTTSLALSAPTKAYGTEESERLSVVVSPKYGGTPVGAVTVSDGSKTLCMVTLAAATASATGSCVLSATALAPGTSELTASYAGSGDFAGSTSVAAFLAISQATTTTVLSLSARTVDYGDEQSERVAVAVTSEYVGVTSGTVTVKSGTRRVCVATITAGKGTCALAASMFAAGTAALTASYAGDGDFAASYSGARTLAVAKADPALAVRMSAGTVVYGKEQGERLSVTVRPEHAGTPTGRVIVKSGDATVCVITLVAGKGSCALSARSLRVGAHDLVVMYPGSADFTSSAAAKVTLRVVR